MKTRLTYFVAVISTLAAPAVAQEKDPWIGKRVFTVSGTVLRVGNTVVNDEGRTADINASGKDRRTVRVYRVEHVNGGWLWIQHETSGVCGWVKSRDVIPYEQAIDYYTDQIRAKPEAYLFNGRGNLWNEKAEYDKAIADYDEAIRLDPAYALAYLDRALAWGNKKEYDKAIADYNKAVRLEPKYALAYLDRALAWGRKKAYDDKAIADQDQSIRLDPKDPAAFLGRGLAWANRKRYDKAFADFNEAIRLDPKYAAAYINRGVTWEREKEYDKAIADYDVGIRLEPENADFYKYRGLAWSLKKEYNRAIADFSEAIRLDPQHVSAHYNRGVAWGNKKEYDKAIADLNEVVRLDPKNAAAYNQRAWLWATCPDEKRRDSKRAVESAARACQLGGWKNASHIDTLAAAYAESGDFARAIDYLKMAIKLVQDPDLKKRWVERLKFYQDKKPYRKG
jgi:tetratricopeptide (TPR) repeat protein